MYAGANVVTWVARMRPPSDVGLVSLAWMSPIRTKPSSVSFTNVWRSIWRCSDSLISTWTDEHPGGEPIIHGDAESMKSILNLLVARASYWRAKQIPQELQLLWEEARKLLPDWPGFRRMHLAPEQMAALEGCTKGADAFVEALEQLAYENEEQQVGGNRH